MATNFNNTTPAAPSNNQNITWQTDGNGNVSAYVPDGVGSVNGQTGAIEIEAGSNITISTSSGTITISATGGGGAVTSVNSQTGAIEIEQGAGIQVSTNSGVITVTNTGVTSINSETGGVELLAGSGISISSSSSGITISASGGSSAANTALFDYGGAGLEVAAALAWSGSFMANSTNNAICLWHFTLPAPMSLSHIAFHVSTDDASNSYDIGLYTESGTLVAHTGPTSYASTGTKITAVSGAPISITAGGYYLAFTSAAGSGALQFTGTTPEWVTPWILVPNPASPAWFISSTSSTSSTLPSSITAPTLSTSNLAYLVNTDLLPIFALTGF